MAKGYIFLFVFSFLTFSFLGSFAQTVTECPSKTVKTQIKKNLKPYKYDASKTARFTYKNKPQKKEIEVPLFLTEKYKIVFNVEGMPVRPSVKIFNKDINAKNREMLFNSDDVKDKTEFEYLTKKWTKHVYVDIEVPAASDSLGTGCVFFVIGYE